MKRRFGWGTPLYLALLLLVACSVTVAEPVRTTRAAATGDPAALTASWVRIADPLPRHSAGFVFDAAHGQLVYFGGVVGSPPAFGDASSSTCLFDSRNWNCPFDVAEDRPQPVSDPHLVYDAARRKVVLFGGKTASGASAETWLWDGNAWGRARPAVSPPARHGAVFVYDDDRQVTLLYGGLGNDGVLDDTWLWDGTDWREVARDRPRPPARWFAQAVRDAARKTIVVNGGASTVNVDPTRDDTWTWDGSAWSQATGAKPPGRTNGAIAYDAARARVVLFGGRGATTDDPLGDTWTWDGTAWTAVTGPGPSGRAYAQIAYDEERKHTVLVGGAFAAATIPIGETWIWDGATWTQATGTEPSKRAQGAIAYDPIGKRVVLVGGLSGQNEAGETWTWDGTGWTLLPSARPVKRVEATFIYDPERKKTLLFGGWDAVGFGYSDTWLWDGARWTQEPLTPAPAVRLQAPAVWDPVRKNVVLFGGTGAAILDDTWLWDGTWKPGPGGPPKRVSAHLVFDSARKNVVMYGGADLDATGTKLVFLDDTWIWDGTAWSGPVPGPRPPPRRFGKMIDFAPQGKVVLYGGTFGDGNEQRRGDTWTWDGTGWTELAGTSPPPRSGMHAVFDEAQQRIVLFGGTYFTRGYPHHRSDTWLFDGNAWEELTLTTRPSARYDGDFVYDPAHERAVLVSGFDGGATLNDTWFWNGAAREWTRAAARATGPTHRFGSAVYDEARREVFVLGGLFNVATVDDAIWRLTQFGDECPAGGCVAGTCVDGVCCKTTTCAGCERCDDPTQRGLCTTVVSAPDPDSCAAPLACDERGACRGVLGRACATGSDCTSGFCADGVCCDRACGGQCEACAVPGGEGRCQPVRGRPRGTRPRCAGDDDAAGDLCAAPSCDGTLSDRCSGTIGPCAPYACTVTGCTDRCTADADCAPDARCDVEIQACVPRPSGAPTCDGNQTLVGAGGFRQSCSPYRCEESRCKDRCASAVDCAAPFECSREGTCVAPLTNVADSVGCSAVPGRRASSHGLLALAIVFGVVLERRRRRALAAVPLLAAAAACGVERRAEEPPPRVASAIGTETALTAAWEVVIAEPVLSAGPVAEWDGARRQLVRYGGIEGNAALVPHTYVFDHVRRWRRIDIPANERPEGRQSGAMAYDAARKRLVLVGGIAFSGRKPETWLWDGFSWTDASARPGATIPATSSESLFYHPAAKTVVLYAGNDRSWVWDGYAWATTEGGPIDQGGSATAYDSVRQRVVYFGGFDGTIEARRDDTWLFDGFTWTLSSATLKPPGRNQHDMVWDDERQRIVLFGGYAEKNGGVSNDTWLWDGAAWTLAAPATKPPKRRNGSMAYDPVRKQTLLIGGSDNLDGGTNLRDTWTWDGTDWTLRTTPPEIGGRSGARLRWDPDANAIVLLGGTSTGTNITWLWDGDKWTTTARGAAPSARSDAQIVYDTERHELVLYGGRSQLVTVQSDTWRFDGSWTQDTAPGPPARIDTAMVWDEARKETVLFGGFAGFAGPELGDTWTRGTAWAQRANGPPARRSMSLLYDAARQKVVLFGGQDAAGPRDDTWLWDGTAWTEATGGRPPARFNASFVWDAKRNRGVLYGGFGAAGLLDDTWLWDGTNWTAAGGPRPPKRQRAQMAYDPNTERVVLFGGEDVLQGQPPFGDTWTWDGTTWTSVPGPAPSARKGAGFVYDPDRRGLVLAGGQGIVNNVTDAWVWSGRWIPTVAPAPPLPRAYASMAYVPELSRMFVFGGRLGLGLQTDQTELLTLYGQSCTTNAECGTTGACVDGVCCAQSECAACERCDAPQRPGTCTLVTRGEDPDTCAGESACDGLGRCKRSLGTTCTGPAECASGFCADGVCCSTECGRQCEACDKKGAVGLCQPVRGAVHGTRTACSEPGASADACGVPACDGVTADRCAGTIGPCAPYACGPTGCNDACKSDADCDALASCDVPTGRCRPVAPEEAVCDGDHSLKKGAEVVQDCTPFGCEGARCKERCTSVLDCSFPFECAKDGRCVAPLSNAGGGGSGGGCAAAPGSANGSALLTAIALLAALSRRRPRARCAAGSGASTAGRSRRT